MPITSAEIDKILNLLEETPQRIISMTCGVEAARLHVKPNEAAWSMNDILAHLRSCADVWGKSMLAMIVQEHPTLRYVSPRTWIRKTDYPVQEFHASLEAFARQRDSLLKSLKTLEIGGWSRGATFKGTVKGREQTIYSYAQRMAEHEVQHLEQMESVLNASLAESQDGRADR